MRKLILSGRGKEGQEKVMIEQTWWNTPYVAIYLTQGRALLLAIFFILWTALISFCMFYLGKNK